MNGKMNAADRAAYDSARAEWAKADAALAALRRADRGGTRESELRAAWDRADDAARELACKVWVD